LGSYAEAERFFRCASAHLNKLSSRFKRNSKLSGRRKFYFHPFNFDPSSSNALLTGDLEWRVFAAFLAK
jgi:hypothetical protein